MPPWISPACLIAALALPLWGGGPAQQAFDHRALDTVLATTVRGEGVDYAAVRREHLATLEAYLGRLDAADLDTLSRDGQLALLINLYNATVIRHVAERFSDGFTVARDEFAIFDEPLVDLGGEPISLNRLENEIIRKRFAEPRIHVALVCAARSCPPLLPRAYRAADLDRVLDQNMRRFIGDRGRNRIDEKNRTLVLSRIFEWFAEDFGGRENLAGYVDRYTDADVGRFAVTFGAYAWDLNVASP